MPVELTVRLPEGIRRTLPDGDHLLGSATGSDVQISHRRSKAGPACFTASMATVGSGLMKGPQAPFHGTDFGLIGPAPNPITSCWTYGLIQLRTQ